MMMMMMVVVVVVVLKRFNAVAILVFILQRIATIFRRICLVVARECLRNRLSKMYTQQDIPAARTHAQLSWNYYNFPALYTRCV